MTSFQCQRFTKWNARAYQFRGSRERLIFLSREDDYGDDKFLGLQLCMRFYLPAGIAQFLQYGISFALNQRPDLIVIATDLLHFDWYQENLHSMYPSLAIPGPFPWPETIVIGRLSHEVC